jgi:SAM-dependent methyltransferase
MTYDAAQEETPADYDPWASYYDLTDADRSSHIEFYTGLLGGGDRSVLELGCGTGTVLHQMALRLKAFGCSEPRCTGVDLSDGMLRVARRRDPSLTWIHGDMRSPPVQGPFDLVYCCFHTLQLLPTETDLLHTFRAIGELLTPSGLFAFDVYQPNIPYIQVPARDRLARAIAAPDGRQLEIRENTRFDPEAHVLLIEWRLREPGKRAPLAEMSIRVRQFYPDEVNRALATAGLLVEGRYGDLDRSTFTSQSKRQVLVCRKAARFGSAAA